MMRFNKLKSITFAKVFCSVDYEIAFDYTLLFCRSTKHWLSLLYCT